MKLFQRCAGIFLLALSPLFLVQATAQPSGGGPSGEEQPAPTINKKKTASSFFQVGLYGGAALTPNSAEFATLPGLISCQGDTALYGSTTGSGFAVAASVGMAPMPADGFMSHIGWNVKLGLSSSSASFETDESIGQSISPSGELSTVISTYTVDAGVTTLLIEPMAYYQISTSTPLIIGLGPSLNYMLGATYDQKEAISSPAGALYADGRDERNVRDGDIEETSSMLVGGTLNIGYDVRLSPIFSLRPELSATLGFSKVVSDTDWTQHAVRLGISLLYNTEADISTPLGPTDGR